MIFTTFFSALITSTACSSANEIDILELAMGTRITETIAPIGMMPAVITPSNFSQLTQVLKCCNTDRAQVAGYNGTSGTFVLHSDGTVASAMTRTLPCTALFFKVYKHPAVTGVVSAVSTGNFLVRKSSEPCATGRAVCWDDPFSLEMRPRPHSSTASCFNPCDLPCSSRSILPVCNPPVCPTVTYPRSCGFESSREAEGLFSIERNFHISGQLSRGSTGVTRLRTSKTFVFQEIFGSCRKEFCLKEVISGDCRLNPSSFDFCSPSNGPIPSCLRCPDALHKTKCQIERLLCSPVCLFVSVCNDVYACANSKLYEAKYAGCELVIKTVDCGCIPQIECQGLFGMEFCK